MTMDNPHASSDDDDEEDKGCRNGDGVPHQRSRSSISSSMSSTDSRPSSSDNGRHPQQSSADEPDVEMGQVSFDTKYNYVSDSFRVVPQLQENGRGNHNNNHNPTCSNLTEDPTAVIAEERSSQGGSSAELDAASIIISDAKNTRSSTTEEEKDEFPSTTRRNNYYDWKLYAPSVHHSLTGLGKFLRWGMVGGSQFATEQSDDELRASLASLAHCLQLLRDYLIEYDMPVRGGPGDQEHVLREVVRDLYAGGTPLWALEPVMQKAAEGLTGQPNINWQLYPRKALLYIPNNNNNTIGGGGNRSSSSGTGTTTMFKMDRGFNISKMSAMEGVVVRLASFASNVQGVSNIPARFPHPHEFRKAARTESVRNLSKSSNTLLPPPILEESKLARKILNLASRQQGLFYYVNSREYMGQRPTVDDVDSTHPSSTTGGAAESGLSGRPNLVNLDAFWIVSDEERELFSRLACQEAMRAIHDIDARANDPNRKTLYTTKVLMLCRFLAAFGACGYWFGGSWQDMIVSGVLSVIVAIIGTSSILSKQERLVYEVVASFVVGCISGLLALAFPDEMCFSAMAISGVLDLLQGFRVVYAIIEIMSKHTVAGGADLLEGILFTGLITYFLQIGAYAATSMYGGEVEFGVCSNSISDYWQFLLVPLSTISWAILFTPLPREIPAMAFHGTLGYCVSYGLNYAGGVPANLIMFLSASSISFSAGIFSRFTGRQAVGNTVAGMFMLLPGAYLVTSLYKGDFSETFFSNILFPAVVIGIGGWTGTILCSPTLLGTTRGLLWQTATATTRFRRSSDSGGLDGTGSRMPPLTPRQTDPKLQDGHEHGSHGSETTTTASRAGPHRRAGSRRTGARQQRHQHHHRLESNMSVFDFEHPTSTMLFF